MTAAAAAELLRRAGGREPEAVWTAPGRVNLIGEHTDYHGGYVLPAAVPWRTAVAAARADQPVLTLITARQAARPVRVPLKRIGPGRPRGWAGYVAGVAWALRELGVEVPGAVLAIDGDVPSGAGLSSSAALECATAGALLALAGVELDPMQVALACQRAENVIVGMPCGIMDQAASMLAEVDHLLLLDCRSLATRQVPLPLAEHGLELLVTDTRAPHRLVDGEYAARRADGEAAASLLRVDSLRDVVDPAAADAALAATAGVGAAELDVLRRRVRHVLGENQRVLDVVALLDAGRPERIGPLLDASHASLRDDYEVSCPELDLAVEAARAAGALGARMTGGGFGGSTVSLVPAEAAAAVGEGIGRAFAAAGFAAPVTRAVRPSRGAAPA